MRRKVGIVGASGFTGLELARLVLGHPHLELAFATSDRWVGELVTSRVGDLTRDPAPSADATSLRFSPAADLPRLAEGCALVFLATPVETSLVLAEGLLARGVRVVDLSGAFRLKRPESFLAAYGRRHELPGLLEEAVYGLPELSRTKVTSARLVANPGCYATAITLALAPLVRRGLVEVGGIAVAASSGVSGAGRRATEDYSFSELAHDFRPYRTLRHQHAPEIAQTLSLLAGEAVSLAFVPHLLPLKRGIVATVFVRARTGAAPGALEEALRADFGGERFVRLRESADAVRLNDVVGTNLVDLGVQRSAEDDTAVVVSALDNLLKGAGGQAIQNANLMLGLDERAGLTALTPRHP